MAPDEEFEMESCRACRGEGKVISNLGGTASEVDCPWCEGSGKYLPEHDAQVHWGPQEGAQEGSEGAKTGPDAPETASEAPEGSVDA